MSRARRWGMTLPLHGYPLPEQREIVTELADLGYTDAWSAELSGIDAFTPLILASQWAPQLRLGTAIAPVYTRGPALLAMTGATMAELTQGRFVLGIGTSTPVVVQQWNDIAFEAPYQRSRDTLRFLRAALAGQKVSERYETFAVNGFRLEQPPAVPPALALAALRPQMIRLGATESDGVITNWLAPDDVPAVREVAGDDCELIARIFVVPTDDVETARAAGRWILTAYLTVPAYYAFHEWLGRADLIRPMMVAWNAGDRKGAGALIPDAVVDDLVVYGTPERCRERIDEYRQRGLDTPVSALISIPGVDLKSWVRQLTPP